MLITLSGIVMLTKLCQYEKASAHILVTPFSIVTVVAVIISMILSPFHSPISAMSPMPEISRVPVDSSKLHVRLSPQVPDVAAVALVPKISLMLGSSMPSPPTATAPNTIIMHSSNDNAPLNFFFMVFPPLFRFAFCRLNAPKRTIIKPKHKIIIPFLSRLG